MLVESPLRFSISVEPGSGESERLDLLPSTENLLAKPLGSGDGERFSCPSE
jgi:hypothetical protein